jgi:hypothetical protein
MTIARDEIGIHRSMCDLVAASIVSITCLKRIQFGPEQRSHRVQEELSLFIRVETGALSTSTSLLASNIVTVLVVNINSIKIMVVDHIDKVSR